MEFGFSVRELSSMDSSEITAYLDRIGYAGELTPSESVFDEYRSVSR